MMMMTMLIMLMRLCGRISTCMLVIQKSTAEKLILK